MEIKWENPANPSQARDYISLKGKRYVRPYYFEFISHVDAVKSGRIQVNGEMVDVSYIVRSSQKISHFLHRHEPPVLAGNIKILENGTDVVTVCKPASIPVHPCGQYRKNTVVGILQAEHGLTPLFPIHRLDRLVSGLLIFAKNADKAESFRQQIESGLVRKEYIAKVVGIFPVEEQVVDANVNYDAKEGRSSIEVDEECTGEILKGKVACTKFSRISTDGKHSLVLCRPITGRTHQIRVHLQYTDHPIANDYLYLSKVAPRRSSFGAGAHKAASTVNDLSPSSPKTQSAHNNDDDSSYDFSIDPMCTNCPDLGPKGYDADEEGLWLHCIRYNGPDWCYECPYPDWALIN